MRAEVMFQRREVIKVTVDLNEIPPGASTEEMENWAVGAYQRENAGRVFEAELGTVVERAPIVKRLPGHRARVTFTLYKELSTD
jgi:hypothetical protein